MILDTTRPYNADASAIESLTDTITFLMASMSKDRRTDFAKQLATRIPKMLAEADRQAESPETPPT